MNILISGGGTGGHIFPALSIADAVKQRHPDAKILFVGALGRMEMECVPKAGYEIIGLPVAGFDRRRPWRNFSVLLKLWRSMRLARKIVREFKPDIAVGVGGYASGPTLKAAQKAGVPTLLQEQNSYAGVTNKLLAAGAARICVAYEGMERFFPADRLILTGNPVRKNITAADATREEALRELGFPADRPLVAITGGSLGARTLNRAMAACVDRLLEKGYSVLWQCGRFYADQYTPLAQDRERLMIVDFIPRMDLVYRAASLVVSRAGASTISELQIAGVPALLVPSPNVAEDHQRHNAMALVNRQAADILLDADCEQQLGDRVIALIEDPARRDLMAANVKAMALDDAADHIARIIDNILK